jgi:predicted RNA-binding Zn-ribbon protein involved in translation (DUF1610 family)
VIKSVEKGAVPGCGTFFCLDCGAQLALNEDEALPECPGCGHSEFRRDSIFEDMQDHGPPTGEFAAPREDRPPAWLHEARTMLGDTGRYLTLCEEERIRIFEIGPGWTRIGRSAAADICLDHPSVSRRHALLVSEPPKALRVLDDRSLNGVLLNGEKVDWGRIGDGDELAIGSYRLFALEA